MGRLTGCKKYKNIQFDGKKGTLVVSNEKLAFQWDDSQDNNDGVPGKNHHKSWKWPDLKEFQVGSDGKGHRKFRIITNKDDSKGMIGFVLLNDDNLEKLKADLGNRILGRGVSPPRSPTKGGGGASPEEEEEKSGSPSGNTNTRASVLPFQILDSVLLKPGQQMVQDYVVGPATNNVIVKTIDQAVVQPTKDNMQLASAKASAYVKVKYASDDDLDNSKKRGDASDDDMDRSAKKGGDDMDNSKKRRNSRNNNKQASIKVVTKDNFPKQLEKLHKQLQDMIKAAPKEDQKAMIFALGCWAQNIANEPMGPPTN